MKEILAVVRMNKMNETKAALTRAGVSAFFGLEATGRGKGLVNRNLLEGAGKGHEEAFEALGDKNRLFPKRCVHIVAHDEMVPEVIAAIIAANRTGKPGDGKIFVLPVDESVRVRTGETGEKAID